MNQGSARPGRILTALAAAALMIAAQGATALADSSASVLPPNWHIHDGQTQLGPQHKPIGFFPKILDITTSVYLHDPARCPDATDKALLPGAGTPSSDVLRAGVCFTSTDVIQLRTVPLGTAGPDGWLWLSGTDGGGFITYYQVTSR